MHTHTHLYKNKRIIENLRDSRSVAHLEQVPTKGPRTLTRPFWTRESFINNVNIHRGEWEVCTENERHQRALPNPRHQCRKQRTECNKRHSSFSRRTVRRITHNPSALPTASRLVLGPICSCRSRERAHNSNEL